MGNQTSQIYLDYAAGTPLDQRVFLAMEPYLKEKFFNPSASYTMSRVIRSDVDEARHRIAMCLGVKPYEITFTAGATESINLAISGVMARYGGNVVTSSIEHQAVLVCATRYPYNIVSVTPHGLLQLDELRRSIDDETTLVSIGYVNNELGTVQSLREIVDIVEMARQDRLARGIKHPLFVHTDASQATGMLDISVSRLGIDMMSLNSGKCYGPKQVGLLWKRPTIELTPQIVGGGQENNLRSGTENVAGIVGFATALELASKMRKEESYRLHGLRQRMSKMLQEAIPDVVVNGHVKKHVPHILHISVPGLDGERALYGLDERGVMVATGSACAANKGTRSHVLAAVGLDDELIEGSLRLSFGRFTNEDEIDRAAEAIIEVVQMERGR